MTLAGAAGLRVVVVAALLLLPLGAPPAVVEVAGASVVVDDWAAADLAFPLTSGQPAMHPVHNEQPPESCSSLDGAVTCGENVAAEKSPADAYPVMEAPPEITDANCQHTADTCVPV